MTMKEYFLRQFRYDHWANLEFLAGASGGAPLPPVARLVAHTLSAQKLWLERLQQVSQTTAVWPTSTTEECVALAEEMRLAWPAYIDQLSDAGFETTIRYRNSKGESWSSRVEDVLTHVLMHSAYHRGQAAAAMRAAGLQPAYTDFIHGVRQGFAD